MTWLEYVVLFGTSEDTVQLLNGSAPKFARMIQDALWENILMHLCRLLDQAAIGRNGNLTVRCLSELVPDVLRPSIIKAIEEAAEKAAFARDWRNRKISHNDLKLSLDIATDSLAPASRLKIREALEALSVLLNLIEWHYMKGEVAYDLFIESPGGAKSLLYFLGAGVRAEARRRERLLAGDYRPEDFA